MFEVCMALSVQSPPLTETSMDLAGLVSPEWTGLGKPDLGTLTAPAPFSINARVLMSHL